MIKLRSHVRGRRGVARAVVDDQATKLGVALPGDAAQAGGERGRRIAGREQDGYRCRHGTIVRYGGWRYEAPGIACRPLAWLRGFLSGWVLMLVGIGVLLAMSAVQVGFLSDDFLMVRYWDRETGSVRWDLVGAEFQGPWFGVRDLYRPLVSLSDAVQAALFGFDSRWFHLANVGMLLVSALSVGAVECVTSTSLRSDNP